jgi:hypothetical protein
MNHHWVKSFVPSFVETLVPKEFEIVVPLPVEKEIELLVPNCVPVEVPLLVDIVVVIEVEVPVYVCDPLLEEFDEDCCVELFVPLLLELFVDEVIEELDPKLVDD